MLVCPHSQKVAAVPPLIMLAIKERRRGKNKWQLGRYSGRKIMVVFCLSLHFLKKLILFDYNVTIIDCKALSFEKCIDSYTFTILPTYTRYRAFPLPQSPLMFL